MELKIFWINILGVWGVDLVALYLARFVSRAFGLIAVYLALVNGLIHILMGLRRRAYNPGLWTSIVLFLPFGIFSLRRITRANRLSARDHRQALGTALLLHIVVFMVMLGGKRRR